jgi:hypothetical protein
VAFSCNGLAIMLAVSSSFLKASEIVLVRVWAWERLHMSKNRNDKIIFLIFFFCNNYSIGKLISEF